MFGMSTVRIHCISYEQDFSRENENNVPTVIRKTKEISNANANRKGIRNSYYCLGFAFDECIPWETFRRSLRNK